MALRGLRAITVPLGIAALLAPAAAGPAACADAEEADDVGLLQSPEAHRQSKADVQEVFPQCKIALQACGCLGATDTSVIQPTEAMSTFGPGVNTTVFKFTCTDSVNSSCLVYSPPGPKMHCLALDSCDGGQVAPYNMNCVVLNRGSMKFTCCSDSTPGWQSCPSCNGNPFR
ncbi:unnamed protein product [Prorocentrum cordatum]|uniref:Uncharacterized protein n=1 Tax=Prorocentrum cordatum TaxID=2364126 RepID=A0ABN9T157_9DINO|nr:unnamed protein product [Polarella glacialis]|mmetsp:Transcript_107192/g.303729  ORF Transcript_107192/g.303729 Transcript_107192/m.303729 type:complete len:172 (+) Transcript_107192:34-549(+)